MSGNVRTEAKKKRTRVHERVSSIAMIKEKRKI